MTGPGGDSFIDGVTTVAKSRTGKTLMAAAWPWLLAALTFVGGIVVRSLQLEPRLLVMESQLKDIAKDTKATRAEMVNFTTTEQRKIVRVGRQAAYATAGFEAYESPGMKAKKAAWAEKYAAAFERMIGPPENNTFDAAYVALFKDVAVP